MGVACPESPVSTKRCTGCGETKPIEEFYLRYADGRSTERIPKCRDCDNTRHRVATPARVIRTRARQRATYELIERHRTEFATLLEDATAEVTAEAERLAKAAEDSTDNHDHAGALPRLKPGPRRKGQDVTERLDVARCAQCAKHHDRGHTCPSCGAIPMTRDEMLAAVGAMLADGLDVIAIGQALRMPMVRVGELVDAALRAERAS